MHSKKFISLPVMWQGDTKIELNKVNGRICQLLDEVDNLHIQLRSAVSEGEVNSKKKSLGEKDEEFKKLSKEAADITDKYATFISIAFDRIESVEPYGTDSGRSASCTIVTFAGVHKHIAKPASVVLMEMANMEENFIARMMEFNESLQKAQALSLIHI